MSPHRLRRVARRPQAFLTEDAAGKTVFVGNRTECALLLMLQQWGIDYKVVRDEEQPRLFRVRAWRGG